MRSACSAAATSSTARYWSLLRRRTSRVHAGVVETGMGLLDDAPFIGQVDER